MPGKCYKGPFLPLSKIEEEIAQQLKLHVTALSLDIGERNLWLEDALEQSVNYISTQFLQSELPVTALSFQVEDQTVKNIQCEIKGSTSPEIIILGAHYDSVLGSPGADDNASGVAGLLVMASLLASINPKPKRTIRLVAFVNEEPPFFYTRLMGSWQYAKACKINHDNIMGMFSIESIGYYSEERYSQNYPFPFNFFYPDTGDFIGFVSNMRSKQLLYNSIGLFRELVNFPSQGLNAPSIVPGVSWSDQWAFWKHGYPAVMITDTAPFRNPYYHTSQDLPESLDYKRFARVVYGLTQVFYELANRDTIVLLPSKRK